jgi:TolB protein
MRNRIKKYNRSFYYSLALAFLLNLCLPLANLNKAFAEDSIYINVGEAEVKRSLLAMPTIKTATDNKEFLQAKNILQAKIEKNLNFTNYFKFIPAASFLEDVNKVSHLPKSSDENNGFDFQKWTDAGAEFLIQGIVRKTGRGAVADLYLYYVPQARLIFKKDYSNGDNSFSEMANDFSNDVMLKLTGKPSIFKTKLVMTTDRNNPGHKEVFTSEWDGSNFQQITTHKSISLSPTWSPGGNQVAYSAFTIDPRKGTRNANLYIYDFRNRKRSLISSRSGINSGADFFPDGKNLLMTLSASGTPDIYKISLDGKTQGRITSGPFGAMNVEPSVSPDGKTIVFSSDRSGRPMVYSMGIDPAIMPAKRITIAGRYNAAPTWSPDGKKIVFAGWDSDHFDIFTMNEDGTNLVRLTQRRKSNGKWSSNEYPSFSPDGRYIVFQSNRTGRTQIYITDLKGSFTVPVTNDKFNYYQPKWSPFLK